MNKGSQITANIHIYFIETMYPINLYLMGFCVVIPSYQSTILIDLQEDTTTLCAVLKGSHVKERNFELR